MSLTFLSEKQSIDLFRPIVNLVKRKCFLAKSTPTAVITHPGLLNLTPLWKNQMDYHFTELSVRLNSTGWDNITTLIRLRDAQSMIANPNCLLFEPPNLFELLKITNNLSFNILKCMKLYLIDFTNNGHLLNWNINGHDSSIILTLLDRTNWS